MTLHNLPAVRTGLMFFLPFYGKSYKRFFLVTEIHLADLHQYFNGNVCAGFYLRKTKTEAEYSEVSLHLNVPRF